MSGRVYKYRLLISIPYPLGLGPIRSQPRIQDHMRLSFETSDLIRTAQNSTFPDCMSVEAFHRDLQEYGKFYGMNEAELMQDRLQLLSIRPKNYLRHLYYIVNTLQIDPSTDEYFKIHTGLAPFMHTWTRSAINSDPPIEISPPSPSSHPSDDEWE